MDEGDSSGFIYLSRNEDSINLMASSADVEEELDNNSNSMSPPPPTHGIKNPIVSMQNLHTNLEPIINMHDKEGSMQASYHLDNLESESSGDENVEFCEDD